MLIWRGLPLGAAHLSRLMLLSLPPFSLYWIGKFALSRRGANVLENAIEPWQHVHQKDTNQKKEGNESRKNLSVLFKYTWMTVSKPPSLVRLKIKKCKKYKKSAHQSWESVMAADTMVRQRRQPSHAPLYWREKKVLTLLWRFDRNFDMQSPFNILICDCS